MVWLTLFAGLVLLLAGGEALVRGSVSVASRLGVSRLLIGLTLVGFGTSMPELVASLQAALAGAPGIAVGNIVGSNIANILLILGVSALILPIPVAQAAFRRDGSVLALVSLAMLAVVLAGTLSRSAGVILLVLLIAYTVGTYLAERRGGPASAVHDGEADLVDIPGLSLAAGLALSVAGIAGVVYGAGLLVDAAVQIASAAGLSEAVIGLTLVAIGTSLPELVTSVTAALRRQGELAFGNVIGSNIFNILGIGGVTALVAPIPVPPQIAGLDIWVMLAATLAMSVAAITGARISRREGGAFLLAYAAYLAFLLLFAAPASA
jgi:cation:H+ antiporter